MISNVANMSKKLPSWSREFDTLVRAIGECKSKAEEDTIISREVDTRATPEAHRSPLIFISLIAWAL